MSLRKAFFFDRDGVVNVSPGAGYVLNWQSFHFMPGIFALLAELKRQDFLLVLVTSQQGVGKGLMTQQDLDEIHANMQAELVKHGAEFDGIYSCTCLGSDPACGCRKPAAEMILKAQQRFQIDLSQSWMIGDHDRDIQMAHHAGVPTTIRVLNAHEPAVTSTFQVQKLEEVLTLLT